MLRQFFSEITNLFLVNRSSDFLKKKCSQVTQVIFVFLLYFLQLDPLYFNMFL